MSRIRAWLQLVRVAALPTALADVWLGASVTDQFRNRDIVGLSLVSLALYAAGMILNDVHDVAEDRRDNPARPLPSGRIPVRIAAAAGFGLLAAGVGGAALLGGRAAAIAGVLAVLILAYDFVLKATPLGPLNMGLCRALNVVLGMSSVTAAHFRDVLTGLSAAAPILLYVFGVSCLARHEVSGARIGARVAAALGIAASLALVAVVPLVQMAIRLPVAYEQIELAPWVVAAGAAFAVAFCAVLLVTRREGSVRRVVGFALIGIVPLQALVAAAHFFIFDFLAAGCILLLIVPVLVLRRASHVT